METAFIDSNLLLLLVVGSAGRRWIGTHKRLSAYEERDFDELVAVAGTFSSLATVPHVVTEVANLARQIREPARTNIFRTLRRLMDSMAELPIASVNGFRRPESDFLGLTDAILLYALEGGAALITDDGKLATRAAELGSAVIRLGKWH